MIFPLPQGTEISVAVCSCKSICCIQQIFAKQPPFPESLGKQWLEVGPETYDTDESTTHIFLYGRQKFSLGLT